MRDHPINFETWVRQVQRDIALLKRQGNGSAYVTLKDDLNEARKEVGRNSATPTAPVELVGQTMLYVDQNGRTRGRAFVQHPAVTKATNGADIEVRGYELWMRTYLPPDPENPDEPEQWTQVDTKVEPTQRVEDLTPDAVYEFRSRAVSEYGRAGQFSTTLRLTVQADETPPRIPSPPSVTNFLGTLMLSWDGTFSEGTQGPDADLAWVRVERSTDGGAAWVDTGHQIDSAVTLPFPGFPFGEAVMFRLVAVDTSGNESAPSQIADGVPQGVVDEDLIGTTIDERITENQQLVREAEERIGQAESGLAGMSQWIEIEGTELSSRLGDAEGALEGATGRLEEAEGRLTDAFGRIDTVEDVASGAAGAASAAQSAANAAQSAADDAEQAALDAAGIAAGKGQVITQVSAPTGSRARAENLWVRLPDHKVHIWNGTQWVAATDPDLIAAAANAATARSEAEAARQAAQAAADAAATAGQQADAARSEASTAQATADEARARAEQAMNAAVNVVPDPSFEKAAYNSDLTDGRGWSVSSSRARSGSQSARSNSTSGTRQLRLAGPIPVLPGQVWRASVWYSTTSDFSGTVGLSKLTIRKQDGSHGDSSTGFVPDDGWGQQVVEYMIPDDGTVTALYLEAWWNGTAGTVWIDDVEFSNITDAKAALDAAAAAQARADVAHDLAGTAQTNADAAMTAAGTKTTTTYATTGPAGNGQRPGDTHRQRDAQRNIIGEWEWTGMAAEGGNGWVKVAISSDAISNLDVGKLTVGAADIDDLVARSIAAASGQFINLDVGQLVVTGSSIVNEQVAERIWTSKLSASKVLANEVLVGGQSNELADIHFRNEKFLKKRLDEWSSPQISSYLWSLFPVGVSGVGRFIGQMISPGTDRFFAFDNPEDGTQVNEGETWRFSVRQRTDVGGARVAVIVRFHDGTFQTVPLSDWSGAGGWNYLSEGTYVVPQHAVALTPIVQFHDSALSARIYAGFSQFGRMVDYNLIVDGNIQARHMDLDSFEASTGFVDLMRTNILTVGAIDNPIILAEGVVTARAVYADEAMGAKLGEFIRVKAGMIEANAVESTHIKAGSILFGHLSGDAIDGKLITGATFQTRTAFPKVILDSAGLRAHTNASTTTFRLDAATGDITVTGGSFTGSTFRTSATGARAEMTSARPLRIYSSTNQVMLDVTAARITMRNGIIEAGTIRAGSLEGTVNLQALGGGMDQARGIMYHPARLSPVTDGVEWRDAGSTAEPGVIGHTGDYSNSYDYLTPLSLRGPKDLFQFPNRTPPQVDLMPNGTLRLRAESISVAGNMTLSSSSVLETHVVRRNMNERNHIYLDILGVRIPAAYTNTTASSSANLHVRSDGYLSRATSALKYKVLVEDAPSEWAERLLEVEPRTWYDRSAAEEYATYLDPQANEEEKVGLASIERIRRVPGLIAEEVEAAGLAEYVQYGPDGAVEGLSYDRLWTLLIPLVKNLRERVGELEARLT